MGTSITTTNSPETDSDSRFKRNITAITSSLDVVGQLRGVQYAFKADEFPDRNFPSSLQLGFIAQDVEKVLPQIVSTKADGYKAIQYSALTPVLANAIKEPKAQFDEQFAKQEHQIASQRDRLTKAIKQMEIQQAAQQARHEQAVEQLWTKIEDLQSEIRRLQR